MLYPAPLTKNTSRAEKKKQTSEGSRESERAVSWIYISLYTSVVVAHAPRDLLSTFVVELFTLLSV